MSLKKVGRALRHSSKKVVSPINIQSAKSRKLFFFLSEIGFRHDNSLNDKGIKKIGSTHKTILDLDSKKFFCPCMSLYLCSIPLKFYSCSPLHNMTARDILYVHMHFCLSDYKCSLHEIYSSVCLLQLTRSLLISYLVLCISLGTLQCENSKRHLCLLKTDGNV